MKLVRINKLPFHQIHFPTENCYITHENEAVALLIKILRDETALKGKGISRYHMRKGHTYKGRGFPVQSCPG